MRGNRRNITQVRPSLLSRHPSHNILRPSNKKLPKFPFKTVIRMGSTTEPTTRYDLEINSIESIRTSSNKRLMKEAFTNAGVRTAPWFRASTLESLLEQAREITNNFEFKLVTKASYGSRGRGNTLISTEDELRDWVQGKNLNQYLFERFMNYGHEFRLHVTKDGCFYTCRKAMRENTPEDERWHFHDSTCVWLLETNERFFKPNTWDRIVADCVAALKEIGADVLSFDVKVQTPNTRNGVAREYQDYILLECNSASSMGDYNDSPSICAQKYIEELPRIIIKKANELNLI